MGLVARRRRLAVVRWIVALVGIGLTVFCLVRLVEVDNRAAQASPWWYLGLTGMALTLLALGSPWSARTAADDRRRRTQQDLQTQRRQHEHERRRFHPEAVVLPVVERVAEHDRRDEQDGGDGAHAPQRRRRPTGDRRHPAIAP